MKKKRKSVLSFFIVMEEGLSGIDIARKIRKEENKCNKRKNMYPFSV